MPVSVSWPQALAWRMERQLLDPVGRHSVVEVVRRLGGVQAQVASAAELGIRVRRRRRAGEIERALADGRLIKTWAMRGALHLVAPTPAPPSWSLIAAAKPGRGPAGTATST
jgi:hypothetical protein